MSSRWRSMAAAVLAGWLLPFAAFAIENRSTSGPEMRAIEQVGGNPLTPSEVQKYADREQESQALEQFAGGDDTGIYIGGGALLILVVVILVLLLR